MRCELRALMGYPTACEEHPCIFWKTVDAAHAATEPGCVLEEFSLTGTVADRLTRWLLAYKLAADRAWVAAAIEAHRTRGATPAPEPEAPIPSYHA